MATKKNAHTPDTESVNDTAPQPSHYDPHIIPSETVAREAREGKNFGHVEHDNPKDTEHIHTRDGYTVDQEGLVNNYAVEPPMYVNEPGDLDDDEAAAAKMRAADREALSKDEDGNMSPKNNWQHKGPGVI